MKFNFFRATLAAAAVCATLTMSAVDKPTFWVPTEKGTPMWSGMSDNGLWGVANIAPSVDGSTNPIGGMIFDVKNRTSVTVKPYIGWMQFSDITDDGKIVVGCTDGYPAYYNTETKAWEILPSLMDSWVGGNLIQVTPDGKYAVGYAQPSYAEWGEFFGCMWDLEKRTVVPLGENAPYLNLQGEDPQASKISSVSPDGRYLVFEIAWYIGGEGWSALYDRIEDKVYPIGYAFDSNGNPAYDGSGFAGGSEPHMSPNGRYITGGCFAVAGSDDAGELPFLYDVETKTRVVYSSKSDEDILATAVTDNGVVIGARPMMNPARDALIRHGNYFYPLSDIFKQAYNVNLEAETQGVGIVTGTPQFVSGDGRTLYSMATATYHDGYMVIFPESLEEACSKVNLLSTYTVSPESGSTFSEISTVNVIFDRPIGLVGAARHIRLMDEEGKVVATAEGVSIPELQNTRLTFYFRPTMLDAGKKYTITLPEGFVTMAGDTQMKAPEIVITYTGRRDGRIEMTGVTPPDNTLLAEFSRSASPITLTFDSDVAINESQYAALYRTGTEEPVVNVLLYASGHQVIAYPAIDQHLFKGYSYTVIIPENSITDLSGKGGNEEIILHYEGSFVNQGSDDDRYIWHEIFGDNGYQGMLFYEGDHLAPGSVATQWGFDKDTTPWLFLKGSDESDDWCIGSHSMYYPAGKSDDWFTSTQLYIPDSNCFLRFEAQSYLKDKDDHLKVYILQTDDIYQYADEAFINRMRTEGKLIADIKLDPGATPEGLEDEWTEYTYNLAEYAEKNIYIGFLNDNDNQSAVFVDNVAVEHDLSFFTSFTNNKYVENLDEILIQPMVTIGSALNEFIALDAVLLDENNNEIDNYTLSDQNLVEGDIVPINFTKPLPLKKGTINAYTLQVTLNSKNGTVETGNINGVVYNLLFSPEKHIVVEEFSGTQCANCPLGIVAMTNLEKSFGEAVLPVVLRCYEGDVTGATVMQYNTFLGMTAAPMARLNRGETSAPMVSVDGDYQFSGRAYDNDVWFDVAGDEMKKTPLLEVKGTGKYNDRGEVMADFNIRAAIDLKDQSIGVFAVLLEDNLLLPQLNNYYTTNDEDLLPWSVGGQYAQRLVPNALFNDIARGAYGDTFYGSLGLIPSNLTGGETYNARVTGYLPPVEDMKFENCKMVLMAIDTATGLVINACRTTFELTDEDNVSEIAGENASVKLNNGLIEITGVEGRFTAEAYSLDGSVVAHVEAENNASMNVPSGLIIVSLKTDKGTTVRKFIVR